MNKKIFTLIASAMMIIFSFGMYGQNVVLQDTVKIKPGEWSASFTNPLNNTLGVQFCVDSIRITKIKTDTLTNQKIMIWVGNSAFTPTEDYDFTTPGVWDNCLHPNIIYASDTSWVQVDFAIVDSITVFGTKHTKIWDKDKQPYIHTYTALTVNPVLRINNVNINAPAVRSGSMVKIAIAPQNGLVNLFNVDTVKLNNEFLYRSNLKPWVADTLFASRVLYATGDTATLYTYTAYSANAISSRQLTRDITVYPAIKVLKLTTDITKSNGYHIIDPNYVSGTEIIKEAGDDILLSVETNDAEINPYVATPVSYKWYGTEGAFSAVGVTQVSVVNAGTYTVEIDDGVTKLVRTFVVKNSAAPSTYKINNIWLDNSIVDKDTMKLVNHAATPYVIKIDDNAAVVKEVINYMFVVNEKIQYLGVANTISFNIPWAISDTTNVDIVVIIDNLQYKKSFVIVTVSPVSNEVIQVGGVYASNGQVRFDLNATYFVKVYNSTGALVFSKELQNDVVSLQRGIYFVVVGNKTYKVVV